MRIFGVNIEYMGFSKRFSPMILSVMAVACLYGGVPAFLGYFNPAPVPLSMSDLTRAGPYEIVKVESPRSNGFLFENKNQEKKYFLDWTELRGVDDVGSASQGYLWMYGGNKFRKIWSVEVDGVSVLTLEVAKRIYSSELKIEAGLWKIGLMLAVLFLLSIFRIGNLDLRGFFN